jgi:hypothetical protein
MKEELVTVTWNKLQDYEKEFIAAMFNNNANVLGDDYFRRKKGSKGFWVTCNILHPCQQDEDQGLWDAGAEITKEGLLKITGADGPSGGDGKLRSVILPDDVKIQIGASIS